MAEWLLESGGYLARVALIPGVGLLLVCWGLWGDRSKGRARCPTCWRNMRGTLPRTQCPACGHDAKQTRRLYKDHFRWRRIALGVVLVFVSAYHPSLEWFLDTGIYLLGIALIPGVGLPLVCWGLWGDRSKGRTRCPKCWYDMRGTVPRLECPECGHDAQRARRLYRTRRGRRRIVIGVVLLLLSAYPLVIITGWWREQALVRRVGAHVVETESIGPKWMADRLPHGFLRFFDRSTNIQVFTDRAVLACERLPYLREVRVIAESDVDIMNVQELAQLERVSLTLTKGVTDAGLVHLTGMSNLEYLDLDSTQVTDAGLVHLKGLSKLEYLSLDGTQVTGPGLAYLKGLSQFLVLSLMSTQVTDAGIVHLKGLSKLECLYLSDTQVTGAGLVHLKGLSKLAVLNLANTQVTDAGLVHLQGLSLYSLDLSGTQVTDAGLVHLQGLTNLYGLNLTNT